MAQLISTELVKRALSTEILRTLAAPVVLQDNDLVLATPVSQPPYTHPLNLGYQPSSQNLDLYHMVLDACAQSLTDKIKEKLVALTTPDEFDKPTFGALSRQCFRSFNRAGRLLISKTIKERLAQDLGKPANLIVLNDPLPSYNTNQAKEAAAANLSMSISQAVFDHGGLFNILDLMNRPQTVTIEHLVDGAIELVAQNLHGA